MTIETQIDHLQAMTVSQLQAKYLVVFGEATNGHNKAWLVKRIAWRMQALAEGPLSDRAKKRAAELANDADLRVTVPRAKPAAATAERTKVVPVRFDRDDHLPVPGTVLSRAYKGRTVHVRVLAGEFEWEGKTYPSLSAVAKAIAPDSNAGGPLGRRALRNVACRPGHCSRDQTTPLVRERELWCVLAHPGHRRKTPLKASRRWPANGTRRPKTPPPRHRRSRPRTCR